MIIYLFKILKFFGGSVFVVVVVLIVFKKGVKETQRKVAGGPESWERGREGRGVERATTQTSVALESHLQSLRDSARGLPRAPGTHATSGQALFPIVTPP